MGEKGLRVLAEKGAGKKETLASAAFTAEAGHVFRLTFWGKMQAPGVTVHMEFRDQEGKTREPVLTKGFFPAMPVVAEGQFDQIVVQAAAPADAATVTVCIDADPRNKGAADLDDFCLEEVPADKAAKAVIPARVPVEPLLAEVEANPYRGQKPPKIVIKVDDLSALADKPGPQNRGPVHPKWQKFVDAMNQRSIKGNIGIVANSLEVDRPGYYQWIKNLNASGHWEIWLHAYDHAFHQVGDKVYTEFVNLPYDAQKERIALCQRLGKEKLGFAFVTFGPPGGGNPIPGATVGTIRTPMDDNTLQALAEDPDMQVVMYPAPMFGQARAVNAQGKLTILDRVWPVNIEYPTFHPRFDQFLEGYVHNRGREFFVMQGHPTHWGDEEFQDFLNMVDFLIAQKAEFVKASELVHPKGATSR